MAGLRRSQTRAWRKQMLELHDENGQNDGVNVSPVERLPTGVYPNQSIKYPYKALARGKYIGQFATVEEARAAYDAVFDASPRKRGRPMEDAK